MPERVRQDQRSRRHRERARGVQYPERREFFGISSLVAAIAGAEIVAGGLTAGIVWTGRVAGQLAVNRLLREYKRQEPIVDSLIQRFEEGFGSFDAEARARIARSNIPITDREVLTNPLDVFRINRANPLRNTYNLKRQDLLTRRSLDTVTTRQQDISFFYYDLIPVEYTDTAAGFAPLTRTLHLSPAYDPNNTLDNLIAAHEMVHVAQDNQDRLEMSAKEYTDFFRGTESRKARVAIAIYEASAFSVEIHLLDLFTDGQFKGDALKGQVDATKYRQLLKARPNQERLISVLGNMASVLYSGRTTLTGIDQQFLSHVSQSYRQQGYEIYDRTSRGFVRVS